MQPHQQRVVDEKAELDTKLLALKTFIKTNPVFLGLDKDERGRLTRQAAIMQDYSDILGERIEAFLKPAVLR